MAELVREKALHLTREEVPHALTVDVEELAREGRARDDLRRDGVAEADRRRQGRCDGAGDRHAREARGRGAPPTPGVPRACASGRGGVARSASSSASGSKRVGGFGSKSARTRDDRDDTLAAGGGPGARGSPAGDHRTPVRGRSYSSSRPSWAGLSVSIATSFLLAFPAPATPLHRHASRGRQVATGSWASSRSTMATVRRSACPDGSARTSGRTCRRRRSPASSRRWSNWRARGAFGGVLSGSPPSRYSITSIEPLPRGRPP